MTLLEAHEAQEGTKRCVCVVCGLALTATVALIFGLRRLIGGAAKCQCSNGLSGKLVLITGATSGLGRETALLCAARGASVVLACRNKSRSEATVTQIRRTTGNEDVHFMLVDLASFKSVKEFVKDFFESYQKLDILINNAAYLGPRQTTVDGHDQTFQVNYLSHFLLTNLILRKIKLDKDKPPLRIINVCSDSYTKGLFNPDDLLKADNNYSDRDYSIFGEYAKSKLAILLFTIELNYKFAHSPVSTMTVHPGAVNTGLLRNWPGLFGALLRTASRLLFRSSADGAQTVLFCALIENEADFRGKLLHDCKTINVEPLYRDYKMSERLWEVSETLCGNYYQDTGRQKKIGVEITEH